MVQKRGQGQRYPPGFTKNQILLKLCEKDGTSTSEIFDFLRDEYNIREQKNIRIHLERLEKQKLIKKESAGSGHLDYWSVVSDIKTLKEFVERLKSDHDLLHAVMRSWYYLGMISLMCDHFQSVLKDAGLPEMNGTEIKFLELNLKCSESCLSFVLNKTSSECKKSFRDMVDEFERAKKECRHLVGKIDHNKVAKTFSSPGGSQINKKMLKNKILMCADGFLLDFAIGVPSLIEFINRLSAGDRCNYAFWLNPNDEDWLRERIIEPRISILENFFTTQISVPI